jgi:hypothetical protein
MAGPLHAGSSAMFIAALSISSVIVAAGEPIGEIASTAPQDGAVVTTETEPSNRPFSPWVSRRLSAPVAERLAAGYDLAAAQLERLHECRALFTELGSDGFEALSTTLYYPAELRQEHEVCRRADAYTIVGGAPTWLCRRFARVTDRRAALLVLHEALHHAGLDEWPHDRTAQSSESINDMISEACGL